MVMCCGRRVEEDVLRVGSECEVRKRKGRSCRARKSQAEEECMRLVIVRKMCLVDDGDCLP